MANNASSSDAGQLLQRQTDLLAAIRQAQSLFILRQEPRRIFAELLRILVAVTNSEYGFLDEVLHDPDGAPYKLSLALSDISWDEDSRRLYQQLTTRNLEFRNLRNLAGAPVLERQVVIANDAPRDPRYQGLPNGHPPLHSYLGIPLFFEGELIGVAGVANRPGGYDLDLVTFLEPLTATCAHLIGAVRARQKEQRIREYIQAVLDSINDAIFVDDANTGQIIDVNRRMCEMYGYSREEALSLNVGQLSAGGEPYSQDNALEWLKKARHEGPQVFEWFAKKRSGAVFWVEVSIRFAVIGGQDRFLVSVRDITDRKQAERIIIDSKNELQQVYDSVPVMICQLTRDRKVIEANEYFRSFTGWPDHPISLSEKACGVLGCINSLDDPRGCGFGPHCKNCPLRLAIEDTFKTGHKHTNIEYKTILIIDGVKKDIVLLGSTALIQKNNQRLVLLSMVDITERKQTEEALQIALTKYQTLFDTFPLGITISDQAGHIVESNLASEKLLGLQKDQHCQRQIDGLEWQIVHPDGTSMPVEEYASVRALKEQHLIDNVEMGIVKAHGEIIWLNVTAAPLPLEDYGAVITYGDITARKQMEEDLQRSVQEKETLLREVHHRVKNNLAAIISLLELQQDRNSDPQNQSLLAEMGGRIRSMALVHEMLYQSTTLSEIDFHAYLQALIRHLRGSFDPQGAIRILVAASGVRMNLDTAIPCGLIVNELVINALKYAFPADRPRTDTDEIVITATWDQVTYTLIVTDNGVGLPADLDWTTTRTLGLRLVRMLGQHQLQGTIELDHSAGVRFLLRFAPHQDRSAADGQGNHSDR